jgi:hypothetical protein
MPSPNPSYDPTTRPAAIPKVSDMQPPSKHTAELLQRARRRQAGSALLRPRRVVVGQRYIFTFAVYFYFPRLLYPLFALLLFLWIFSLYPLSISAFSHHSWKPGASTHPT